MVEIDTLFQTIMAQKNIPFGAAHTHIAYIKDAPPPPGAKNAVQIMSLAAKVPKRKILRNMYGPICGLTK